MWSLNNSSNFRNVQVDIVPTNKHCLVNRYKFVKIVWNVNKYQWLPLNCVKLLWRRQKEEAFTVLPQKHSWEESQSSTQHRDYLNHIVAWRPVARQRMRDKHIYNSCCYVITRKQQQRNGIFCAVGADGGTRNKGTATEERGFPCGLCRGVKCKTS
jgi:hypothetical protein